MIFFNRAQNKPLSRAILAEKAKEFKSKCDRTIIAYTKDFEASSGFIDKFCQRHGLKLDSSSPKLKSIKISTTTTSSLETTTYSGSSFKDELNRLVNVENYSPNQLFYFGEAGLMWNTSLAPLLSNGS